MTFDIVALCVQQPDPTTTITATFLPVPLLVHELDTVGLAGSAAPHPVELTDTVGLAGWCRRRHDRGGTRKPASPSTSSTPA